MSSHFKSMQNKNCTNEFPMAKINAEFFPPYCLELFYMLEMSALNSLLSWIPNNLTPL